MKKYLLNTSMLFVMSTMFLACNVDDSPVNLSKKKCKRY